MRRKMHTTCNRRALFVIPLLFGLLSCSQDTILPGESTLGLQNDPLIEAVWPPGDQVARVSYINEVQQASSWIMDHDNMIANIRSVAINVEGELAYFSGYSGVLVVNTTNGVLTPFAAEIGNAHGLAVAESGNVYVVNKDTASVFVYSSENQFLFELGAGEFTDPQGLAIDHTRGLLYVADARGNSVSAWQLDGTVSHDLDQSEFSIVMPLDVAVNSDGQVYVVNFQSEHHIQVYGTDGSYQFSFGPTGLFPSQFQRPKGIAIDSDNNVYVSDTVFGNVQLFNSEGRHLMTVGTNGPNVGEFMAPSQLAIDRQDRIWVPEYGINRIQVFQYLSH